MPELLEILDRLGLSPFVAKVYNSAILGVEKPNPKIFQKALADLGPYEEVWMVGDNFHADYLGAQAVGINAILARRANPAVERFAESLASVPALLGVGGAESSVDEVASSR